MTSGIVASLSGKGAMPKPLPFFRRQDACWTKVDRLKIIVRCKTVNPETLFSNKFSPNSAHALDPPSYNQQTVQWIDTFLTQPHPKLGVKKRSVCPYAREALDSNSIWLRTDFSGLDGEDSIRSRISEMEHAFPLLMPLTGHGVRNKALVTVFPNLQCAEGDRLLSRMQLEFKERFVVQGMMLGSFHRLQTFGGLHSDKFKPFRSPQPLLVTRCLVETDLPFLEDQRIAPSLRIQLLKAYLNTNAPVGKIEQANASLSCAMEEMGNENRD